VHLAVFGLLSLNLSRRGVHLFRLNCFKTHCAKLDAQAHSVGTGKEQAYPKGKLSISPVLEWQIYASEAEGAQLSLENAKAYVK